MTSVGTETIANQKEEQPDQTYYDDYVITWTKPLMNGKAPNGRGGQSLIFAENKLVVFGGHYFGGKNTFYYLNDTLVLDLKTSTWSEIKCTGNPPPGRYNHSATVIGHRMFIFGGKGAKGQIYKDMYFLDLEDWCWYPVNWTTGSPAPRFDHAHAAVGNKIVVFGGWNGKHSLGDLWVFDTEAFTWMQPETAAKSPCARHGHTMTLLEDGRLMVFGGYSVQGKPETSPVYHGDVHMLDTETMIWARPRVTGTYPKPRFGHSVLVHEDMVLVVGGWTGTEKSMISIGDKVLRAEILNKRNEERLQMGYQKVHSTSPPSIQSTSQYVLLFNTTTMSWETPPLRGLQVSNRYGHSSALVGPHVFVFGGWDGCRSVNELYVADLPTNDDV